MKVIIHSFIFIFLLGGKSTSISENYSLGKYVRIFSDKDYDDSPGEIHAIIFGFSENESFSFKVRVLRFTPCHISCEQLTALK